MSRRSSVRSTSYVLQAGSVVVVLRPRATTARSRFLQAQEARLCGFGPTDAAGNSSSGNAATVTLSPSASSTTKPPPARLPPLLVKHAVHGHKLTVIALVPVGVGGPVQFRVQAVRGRIRVANMSRRAKVSRGRAKVVFVLSRVALSASRLSILASAQGAASAALSVMLHRRSHRSR